MGDIDRKEKGLLEGVASFFVGSNNICLMAVFDTYLVEYGR